MFQSSELGANKWLLLWACGCCLAPLPVRFCLDGAAQKVKMGLAENTRFETTQFSETTAVSVDSNSLWGDDAPELKPCWNKPSLEELDQSEGYVTFSLTDGPEYHVSQSFLKKHCRSLSSRA